MLAIGDIIQGARDEHPSFSRDRHSHRICIDYLSERHRVYYKELADVLKDRLSVEAQVDANVLAIQGADGVVYAIDSGQAGHQVVVGRLDGVPYLATALISQGDFTLPPDSLQIIAISAEISGTAERRPVGWLGQSQRSQGSSGELVGTVVGFQFQPLINPPDTQTEWDEVEALHVAYIPEPPEFDSTSAATLEDEILIPTVYGHVLKWELAAFLARREMATNKDFPPDLASFYAGEAIQSREATKAGAVLDHRLIKTHRTARNR
jgi:hypothetical protein